MQNSKLVSTNNVPNNNDNSASSNSKFIRKTNSQAFNSFENMLKYKAKTEGPEIDSPKKSIERKSTLETGKNKSNKKVETIPEEPVKNIMQAVVSKDHIEDVAMHMCTNIFLNSTTRFLKGQNDSGSVQQSQSKQKKRSLTGKAGNQGAVTNRQPAVTPKSTMTPTKSQAVSPGPSITSILSYQTPRNATEAIKSNQKSNGQSISRPGTNVAPKQPVSKNEINSSDNVGVNANRMKNQQQAASGNSLQSETSRNPESTAYKMAGERYMSSTTRYVKGSGVESSDKRKSQSPKNEAKSRQKPNSPSKDTISQPKIEPKPQERIQRVQPKQQVRKVSPGKPVVQPRQDIQSNDRRKSVEKNAYHMTGQNYLNSTTKYTKIDGQASNDSGRYSPGKQSPSKEQAVSKQKSPPPNKVESSVVIERKNNLPITTPARNRFQTQVKKNQTPAPAPAPIPASNLTPARNLINRPEVSTKNVEKNAYNMTGQSYMNSTTKYTKIDGQVGNSSGRYSPGKGSPSKDQQGSKQKSREPVSPPKKVESSQKNPIKPVMINDTPKSSIGIESKNNLPIVTPTRNRFQTQVKKNQTPAPSPTPVPTPTINRPQVSEKSVEKKAYNMTGESYFNSTTKYTKIDGQVSNTSGRYSPGKQSPSKEQAVSRQKSRGQASPPNKVESSVVIERKNNLPITTPARNRFQTQVKKNQTPAPAPAPIPGPTPARNLINRPQISEKSIEKNAYNMAGQSYMNSTTKYVKLDLNPAQSSGTYSPKKETPRQKSNSQPKNQQRYKQNQQSSSPPKQNLPAQPSYTSRPGTVKQNPSSQPQTARPTSQQRAITERSGSRQNNAFKMTTDTYLNSTTKYVKEAGSPTKNDNSRYSPPATERSINNKGSQRNIAQAKQEPLKPAQSQTNQTEQSQSRYGRNKVQQTSSSNQNIQSSQVASKVETNSKQNNRSSPSPQANLNLPKNQIKVEQSISVGSDKNDGKQEGNSSKTPFTRQPVNKNGRNLIFTNKGEEATSAKEQNPNQSQPFVTQKNYGQKSIKNAGSAQIKTEPEQNSGKIGRKGPNNTAQQNTGSQRQINGHQNAQMNHSQSSGLINRPNQSKVEEPKGQKPMIASKRAPVERNNNNLVNSKSAQSVGYKPSQAPSSRFNKLDQSTSIQSIDPFKKAEVKVNPRQNQQRVEIINNSRVVQLPKAEAQAKQTAKIGIQHQATKTIPTQDTTGPKSPANRYPYNKQQPSEDTTKSTRVTNVSAKNSFIQPSASNNVSSRQQIIDKTKNSQAQNSQKQISHVKSLSKIDPFVKSESTKTIKTSISERQLKVEEKVENPLPKSAAVLYVAARWVQNAKRTAFGTIKEKRSDKVRYSQEAIILANSTHTFSCNLVTNNYKTVLDRLKKIFVSSLKNKKQVVIKPEQTKEKVACILQRYLSIKFKQIFSQIKTHSWISKQSATQTNDKNKVDNLQKDQKKEKDEAQRQNLVSLSTISRTLKQSKLRQGFDKILVRSLDVLSKTKSSDLQTSNPSKSMTPIKNALKIVAKDSLSKKNELLSFNSDINSDITGIEYKISDNKRYIQREKNKNMKKLGDLRLKNKKSEKEVEYKRKKHELLKEKQQKQGQTTELDLPDDQSLAKTLCKIYSEVFRNKNETLDGESLVKRYNLQTEDSNPLVNEWNSLAKNMEIKLQISTWQGVNKKEGKVRRTMKDERQTETDLMKNYLRERYLWEWVHTVTSRL